MIKNFIKASSWVLAGNLTSKIINFVSLSILARFLDPRGLGIYNALLASAVSVNQISDLGSSIVLQKESAKSSKSIYVKTSLFYTSLGLQLVVNLLLCSLVLFFPSYFYSHFFKDMGSIDLVYYSIPLILFQCLALVPLTFVVGLGEFKLYSIRTIVSSLLMTCLLVVLLIMVSATIQTAITALIISSFINIIISWVVIYPIIKKQGFHFDWDKIKSNLGLIRKDGFIYYVGNTLIGAVVTLALVGLFSTYISIENYGFLRIASSLTAILGIIPAAIQPVTINFLSKSENNALALKSLQIRFLSFFIIMVTFILLIFLNPMISLLFGEDYLQGRNIIIFLISIQILILTSGLLSNFLVSSGHTKFIGIASIFGSTSYLVFALLLIPKFGIKGFYLSHFIGFFIGFLAMGLKEANLSNYRFSREMRYSIFMFVLSHVLVIPIFCFKSFGYLFLYGMVVCTCFLIFFMSKILKKNEKLQLYKLTGLKILNIE